MKVVTTLAARTDLLEIGEFIADENPVRAIAIVKALFAKARGIGRNPKAFSLAPGLEADQIRRRIYADYLIFYQIENRTVSVVRVVHGSRNYLRMLAPDNQEGAPDV